MHKEFQWECRRIKTSREIKHRWKFSRSGRFTTGRKRPGFYWMLFGPHKRSGRRGEKKILETNLLGSINTLPCFDWMLGSLRWGYLCKIATVVITVWQHHVSGRSIWTQSACTAMSWF
jgi:hypothetical protein